MNDRCPLCEQTTQITPAGAGRAAYCVACRSCGNYEISGTAMAIAIPHEKKHILSGMTRNGSEGGNVLTLTTSNIEELIASAPLPDGPLEMIDLILLYVYKHAPKAGEAVQLGGDDYPVAFARGSGEFSFLLNNIEKMNLLEKPDDGQYRLTIRGWEKVAELRKKARDSSQAFVAMWFHKSLTPFWENGFKPALEETGFHPIRIDRVEHNKKIDDEIIAQIRRSGLVVADFTGNRGGVYFEAGFALGLGIPVIWTCRKEDIKKVHFDTRQYNHIVWENAENLKEKLVNRINATLPHRTRRSFVD